MKAKWLLVIVLFGLSLAAAPGKAEAGGDPPAIYQQSYDAEAAGNVAQALSIFEALQKPDSDTYVANLRRAWLLHLLGREADSVDAYNNAINLAPTSVEARVGQLLPLMALRRWADVEKAAKQVLEHDPGNYLAGLRLAYTYYSLGRFADARSAYGRLIEMYPSDVEVKAGFGWSLLKLGRAADAVQQFRQVLAIAPKNTLAREGLLAAGVAP